jgi:hypothetical protein
MVALVFAWQMGPLKRFLWTIGLSLFLVFATCFLWQNLGLFFDFFIPLTLLGAHAVIDKVLEWRRRSADHAKLLATLKARGEPFASLAAESEG